MPSDIPIVINETDIQQAFAEDWFSLVYQPQVSLGNMREIIGAEAFVRLHHPSLGVLQPISFLPVIKELGLTLQLTCLIFEKVAKDWIEWNDKGSNINVSVNIDSELIEDAQLTKSLGAIISDYKIPRHKITLEITNLWNHSDFKNRIGKKLLALRTKGYRISIDGYGVGEVNDAMFEDFPIDEIKLDRQIVSHLIHSDENKNTAKRALHLSNKYGLRLVAVGVEDKPTSEWLNNLGCHVAQGYFICKPLASLDFYNQLIQSGELSVAENSTISILILEDDPQYQRLLTQSLSDNYSVKALGTVEDAITYKSSFSPNIIICDVHLPDGSGIEFCQQHINANEMDSPSVIFISGAQDFQNRLQAYEVGGADFIPKPFSIPELLGKIRALSNYQLSKRQLLENVQTANKLVMQSLKETAYFGDIVQFMKNILTSQDEAQIARELFNFMAQKGLFTCIEFRDGETVTSFDQVNGTCSPVELNVFELLRDQGRLYPFGQRLLINDVHVSFLLKNMPENEVDQGTVRDYVAVLIEGMEARYREILRQRVVGVVTQRLEQLTQKLLAVVDKDQKEENDLLDSYSLELQMSFHSLDLTEEQEQHINSIINKMVKHREQKQQSSADIGKEVNSILCSMNDSLGRIDSETQTNESGDEELGKATIELF